MTDAVMNEPMGPDRTDQDTSARSGLDFPPVRFVFLAKGFSLIFWGLLLAMILFFGNASVEVFHVVRIPAYVVGSALAAWGVWMLSDAGAISGPWHRHVRATLILVSLQIYFAPFVEWWKLSPHKMIYLVNVIGLLLVSMLTLFYVNRLAADLFRRLQNRSGRIEAWVFGGGVVVLMIVPLVLTTVACLVATMRYQTNFEFEMWQTIIQLPIWVYMILTIPCSLTLVTAWKARELCLRRLAQDDRDATPTHG